MSLGLPVHVAPYAVSLAMVRALHVMAAVLLGTAFVFVTLYQVVSP